MIIDNAFNNAFNNDDSWWGRLLQRAPHWMIYVLPFGITAQLVNSVLLWCTSKTVRGPALEGVSAALIVLSMGTSVLICTYFMHNSLTRICVQCMIDVPADAPRRAQKRQRMLWLRHFAGTRRGLTMAAALFLIELAGPATPIGSLGGIPVTVWAAVLWVTDWVHHRLRPWCRYCRNWGDGGMREPSPDPVNHDELIH